MIAKWDHRLLGGYHIIVGIVGFGLTVDNLVPVVPETNWSNRLIILFLLGYAGFLTYTGFRLLRRDPRAWWVARRLQLMQVVQVALPGASWFLAVGPRVSVMLGGGEGFAMTWSSFSDTAAIYFGSHDVPMLLGINIVPVAILIALRETRVAGAPPPTEGADSLPPQVKNAV